MKFATISKAETGTHKPLVTGSIPAAATNFSLQMSLRFPMQSGRGNLLRLIQHSYLFRVKVRMKLAFRDEFTSLSNNGFQCTGIQFIM